MNEVNLAGVMLIVAGVVFLFDVRGAATHLSYLSPKDPPWGRFRLLNVRIGGFTMVLGGVLMQFWAQ